MKQSYSQNLLSKIEQKKIPKKVPSAIVINNILNYSKALSIVNSAEVQIEMILN